MNSFSKNLQPMPPSPSGVDGAQQGCVTEKVRSGSAAATKLEKGWLIWRRLSHKEYKSKKMTDSKINILQPE